MNLVPITKFFEVYGGASYGQFERLDVASLNGFVCDNNNLVNDPHVLVLRSSDKELDNHLLGVDEEKIMVFAGEDAAYKFQEQFTDLFSTRFWVCLT